jgi:hypothetical protein
VAYQMMARLHMNHGAPPLSRTPGEGILREACQLKKEKAMTADLLESSYSSDEEDNTLPFKARASTKPTFKPASTSTKSTFKPASPPPTASPAPKQQIDKVTAAFGKIKIQTQKPNVSSKMFPLTTQ